MTAEGKLDLKVCVGVWGGDYRNVQHVPLQHCVEWHKNLDGAEIWVGV